MVLKIAIPGKMQFKMMRREPYLLHRKGDVHYIGGAEVLPPPLPSEQENQVIGDLGTEYEDEAKAILIEHNLRLVVYIAKKFDNTGVGVEDLISIGTIGLIKSINTFNPEKNIKLATYASRCISNGLAKVAASQLRARNIPLALTAPLDEAGNVSAPSQDEPEEIVIRQEQSRDRSHRMKAELSEYELACLQLLLDGCSYAEIAGRLGRTVKSVDRALGRARQKLRRALAEPV